MKISKFPKIKGDDKVYLPTLSDEPFMAYQTINAKLVAVVHAGGSYQVGFDEDGKTPNGQRVAYKATKIIKDYLETNLGIKLLE